jgi:hypothetical protein
MIWVPLVALIVGVVFGGIVLFSVRYVRRLWCWLIPAIEWGMYEQELRRARDLEALERLEEANRMIEAGKVEDLARFDMKLEEALTDEQSEQLFRDIRRRLESEPVYPHRRHRGRGASDSDRDDLRPDSL